MSLIADIEELKGRAGKHGLSLTEAMHTSKLCNQMAPRLIAQVERMEGALRLIDDKIGHFAKAPKDDSMVIVSIIGDIARQTKEALKGMEE